MNPEDYSNGRASAARDPVIQHVSGGRNTHQCWLERKEAPQIGKGIDGSVEGSSSIEEMCGSWSGELEKCCISCISGRRLSTSTSDVVGSTGSLGLALLQNYEKRAMTVIGLEFGGPAERSGRVEVGDELVRIDGHCVETLLSSAEGEDVVHNLLAGIIRMQDHTWARTCICEYACIHVLACTVCSELRLIIFYTCVCACVLCRLEFRRTWHWCHAHFQAFGGRIF